MKITVTSLFLILCLTGCLRMRVEDRQRDIVFTSSMPSWPWQDNQRSLERLNVSGRGTNFTISIRGLEETESGATNFPKILEAVIGAAVRAAK